MQLLSIILGAFIATGLCLACGAVIARATPLPLAVRLSAGAVPASLLIFTALACHIGFWPLYLTAAAIPIAIRIRLPLPRIRRPGPMPWFFRIVFSCYGSMYLICALSPEIQPDAASYHLHLVSEYARLHAFANRIAFFDAIPQGMEMLYVPAFAMGGASAAKVVHYVFLIATVPLIRHICMELGFQDRVGCTGAAIFFLAPVSGVAGTSAYTDAGLVCGCLSVLYLLIRWESERASSLLFMAALIAGFCYSIKQTFGWVVAVCCVFVWVRSGRFKRAAAFGAVSMIAVVPWIVRGWIVYRNPFAPFLNSWFPNRVSTPAVEAELAASFSAFRPDFHWSTALQDYTVLGGHEGLLGPAFLLLPLALLALRMKQGRWLLTASLALAVPFLANTGTRFLLPAMAPAAMAIASVLPGPAALIVTAVQAIGSFPAMMDRYDRRKEWRLREIPLRAALRVEPEPVFLERSIKDFGVTRLIANNAVAGSRVFSLIPVPELYIQREVLLYWQSALGRRRLDSLLFAKASRGTSAELVSCDWRPHEFQTLRITAESGLTILETAFNKGGPGASVWKTLTPGDSISLSAPPSAKSTAVDLLLWPGDSSPQILAKSETRGWLNIGPAARVSRVSIDVRRDATAALRAAGFSYILARTAGDSYVPLATDLLRHSSEWGLEPVAAYRDYWLFHVMPDPL